MERDGREDVAGQPDSGLFPPSHHAQLPQFAPKNSQQNWLRLIALATVCGALVFALIVLAGGPVWRAGLIGGAVIVTTALVMFFESRRFELMTAQRERVAALEKDIFRTAKDAHQKRESELRNLRQQLRTAQLEAKAAGRAKQAFISQLNHNIRTPLNHILGFAELIRQQAFGELGNRRYLTYVEDIQRSGEVLMSSFSQILELADITNGNRPLTVKQIDMAALEHNLQRRYAKRAETAGIRLTIGLSAELDFHSDQHCMSRILDSLVSNAIKFTQRGGHVDVDLIADVDAVVIRIADDGIGISQEQLSCLNLPYAFDEFEQVHSHRGAGMGLAMARTLAELCGGELRIDSTLGVGTTVGVLLPNQKIGSSSADGSLAA